jgi:plastocyanin
LRNLIVPLVVAGLLGPAVAPAVAGTVRVKVGDNYFVRETGVPTVRASKGDKVRWVWRGKSLHNVKVTKGPAKFGSPSKSSGSFSKQVNRAGTYTIICTVHGADDQSMKLVVR